MTSYLKEHFEIIAWIADQSIPQIRAEHLLIRYKQHVVDQLLSCGALVPAPHLLSVTRKGKDGRPGFKSITYSNGKGSYISEGKTLDIDDAEVLVYAASLDWSLKGFLYGFGLSAKHKCITILDQCIWSLGNIQLFQHKVLIIIVRNIIDDLVYTSLERYLKFQKSTTPILVITLIKELPSFFKLPPPHILIKVPDIIVHDENEKLSFDIELILEKSGKTIKKEGFSDGYRSAYFNGVAYSFSKIQAEVLELLDKAVGKRMHQDEIMSRITTNSSNTRLVSLFQSKGKMHPAWGVIIQHDSKGFYWIHN